MSEQVAKVYVLKNPIQLVDGAEPITEFQFRKFGVRELRAIPFKIETFATHFALAELLTGQPSAVINRLSAEDSAEVLAITNELASPFLAKALERLS